MVGFDRHINYHKIQYATLCISENPGCHFIATNLDAKTHLTDAQEWAGNGSMVGAIKGEDYSIFTSTQLRSANLPRHLSSPAPAQHGFNCHPFAANGTWHWTLHRKPLYQMLLVCCQSSIQVYVLRRWAQTAGLTVDGTLQASVAVYQEPIL